MKNVLDIHFGNDMNTPIKDLCSLDRINIKRYLLLMYTTNKVEVDKFLQLQDIKIQDFNNIMRNWNDEQH